MCSRGDSECATGLPMTPTIRTGARTAWRASVVFNSGKGRSSGGVALGVAVAAVRQWGPAVQGKPRDCPSFSLASCSA